MILSVVIPALNAASTLPATLESVGGSAEVIVADGGSSDGTGGVARGARVVSAPRGRGIQIAAGVAAATHPWLLLLHADTILSGGWREAVAAHLAAGSDRAGYFRFRLDSPDSRARRLERMVAWRCRMFALPYGDQGLLIHRDLLARIGGVQPLPLMEDVDLIRRLGRGRLVSLDADAITSAAKWERDGYLRRSARNLFCLALWFAGAPPGVILRIYG